MKQRVGVIGGGQLAWMMADAANALGIELVVQTPNPDDPAVAIATDTILAAVDDAMATAELAKHCNVITFENEFVNLEALFPLEQQGICFYPQLSSLAHLLDKYHQRRFLQGLGLPVPEFADVDLPVFLPDFAQLGYLEFPIVLKSRRLGYDGQGTFILKAPAELEGVMEQMANQPLMIERFVPFERELAIMAARSISGEIITYPLVETQQEQQVCRRVVVTQEFDSSITQQAEAIARTLLESLQVVGIFGIELFLTTDGQLLINEIAPRTHNSGHYTLDACVTSQFEQHLRAVCGLPLGKPQLLADTAVMVNLLGFEHSDSDYLSQRQQMADIPNAHVHWYGKTVSRPGRKLGHVTVLLNQTSPASARSQALDLASTIESIWYP
ncbi:5-(carboxyamino)imidazole ribonucleotide synthase [Oculatella sp. LEGE 06141]|uniref:5-(carboxyamino)imidazole ribonucleotide synthase n=1 Tax=Oculatella sp. LEGE 06141 TaxID=1828648 RepID=UPI00187F52E8|nr:5-(carboxyamino)imidazole ribonucleotide synthase [Oculatella sp. LEGE 06141]MBE9180796.1 5-(carboxyamino)imidazole ribonucleotide synthase [Oculatella sp. LEGE 06141]